MTGERFWKFIALSSLALLAYATLAGNGERPVDLETLFVSSAQAGGASTYRNSNMAVTTNEGGNILYAWNVENTGPTFVGRAVAQELDSDPFGR